MTIKRWYPGIVTVLLTLHYPQQWYVSVRWLRCRGNGSWMYYRTLKRHAFDKFSKKKRKKIHISNVGKFHQTHSFDHWKLDQFNRPFFSSIEPIKNFALRFWSIQHWIRSCEICMSFLKTDASCGFIRHGIRKTGPKVFDKRSVAWFQFRRHRCTEQKPKPKRQKDEK